MSEHQVSVDKPKTLSGNQINMFNVCQFKWYCYAVRRIESRPPGSKIALGRFYDETLNVNFEQKIVSSKDLSTDELLDVFNTYFDKGKDEIDWESNIDKADTRQMGQNILKKMSEGIETLIVKPGIPEVVEYSKRPFVSMMPKNVQKKYTLQLPGVPWLLVGIPDLETVDGTTIDHKTKTGLVHEADGNHIVTADIYSIAKNIEMGAGAVTKRRIDYVIKNKTPKLVQVEIPDLSEAGIEYFKIKVATQFQQMELIRRGLMRPDTNRGHMYCNSKCQYAEICLKENRGYIKGMNS